MTRVFFSLIIFTTKKETHAGHTTRMCFCKVQELITEQQAQTTLFG